MDLGISDRVAPTLEAVSQYIAEHVMPLEPEFFAEVRTGSLAAHCPPD